VPENLTFLEAIVLNSVRRVCVFSRLFFGGLGLGTAGLGLEGAGLGLGLETIGLGTLDYKTAK